MKVNIVRKREQPLSVTPIMSMNEANRLAIDIARKLSAHEQKMPWIREDGVTYRINKYNGIEACGFYGRSRNLSMEGCAQLIAKARALLNKAEEETRLALAQYPSAVAEAMLSNNGESCSVVDTLEKIVSNKKEELAGIFKGIKAPEGCVLRLDARQERHHGNYSLYLKFDSRGQVTVEWIGESVWAKLKFLKEFDELKKIAVSVRLLFGSVPSEKTGCKDG